MITRESFFADLKGYHKPKNAWACENFMDTIDPRFFTTTESFFGVQNEFADSVVNTLSDMKNLYVSDFQGKKIDEATFQMKFKIHVYRLEEIIRKATNSESVHLGISKGKNASSYPLCCDDRISKSKSARARNPDINPDELRTSFEEIIEKKDGYRFKTPDGKKIIIVLGIGLFDRMSPREIGAILFHEIGHCFQQMLDSINAMTIHYSYREIANSFDLIFGIVSTILGMKWIQTLFGKFKQFKLFEKALEVLVAYVKDQWFFDMIMQFGAFAVIRFIIANPDMKEPNLIAQKLIMEADRDKIAEQVEKQTDDTLSDDGDHKIFSRIMPVVIKSLMTMITVLVCIIAPLFSFIPRMLSIIGSIAARAPVVGASDRGKRYEQFADYFATAYGFGSDLGTALAKLGTEEAEAKAGYVGFLFNVPILNVFLALNWQSLTWFSRLSDGYDEPTNRIGVSYKTLQFELDHNTDLSNKDKAVLREQMGLLEKTYNGMHNSDSGAMRAFSLVTTLGQDIEFAGNMTGVEQNVLIVLETKKKGVVEKILAEAIASKPKSMSLSERMKMFTMGITMFLKSSKRTKKVYEMI